AKYARNRHSHGTGSEARRCRPLLRGTRFAAWCDRGRDRSGRLVCLDAVVRESALRRECDGSGIVFGRLTAGAHMCADSRGCPCVESGSDGSGGCSSISITSAAGLILILIHIEITPDDDSASVSRAQLPLEHIG